MTINVFLVDDHPIVRRGLEAALSTDITLEVIGQAASPEEALESIQNLEQVDVVLMDLQFGQASTLSGSEGTRLIRQLDNAPEVLIVTTYATDANILPAIQAGAVGYILKDTSLPELISSIHKANHGETTLSPQISQKLVNYSFRPLETLTTRELDVLVLVSQGQSNREIAQTLFLTEGTVKSHLNHIYTKLGVDSRTAAVSIARQRGMIT